MWKNLHGERIKTREVGCSWKTLMVHVWEGLQYVFAVCFCNVLVQCVFIFGADSEHTSCSVVLQYVVAVRCGSMLFFPISCCSVSLSLEQIRKRFGANLLDEVSVWAKCVCVMSHIQVMSLIMSHIWRKEEIRSIRVERRWVLLQKDKWTNRLLRTCQDGDTLQHTTTHCTTLHHTATHCNALQRTATHCKTLQHTATSKDF